MKRRTNVWLDDDDRANAQLVATHHGLDSISAALRFAANELARRIRDEGLDRTNDSQNDSQPGKTPQEKR